jgi:hypothetical protein
MVKERDVLFPRQACENLQLALGCGIENTRRRHGVRAYDIEAVHRDRAEIRQDTLLQWKLVAILVGRERPVRDASEIERRAVAHEQLAGGDNRAWPHLTFPEHSVQRSA